jgi:toxin-antitoxin system PIN domain toxin
MIGIDTNILVYAHRSDMSFHSKADQFLSDLINDSISIAIPYPCLSEFLSIVTNPKIFKIPSPREIALQELENFLTLPNVYCIGELTGYFSLYKEISIKAKISGGEFHDARIAAICIQHEIKVFYSADRDFNRFPKLKIKNPLM